MSEKRKPWMKFYPADWQADDALAQCSLQAQGLWIGMIAIMHKSEVYGHLLIAGVNPSLDQLSSAMRKPLKIVKAALEELEGWRIFSRTDDGVIFSRRMVADAEREKRDSDNGGRGGNPLLKPQVNPPANPDVIQGVNPPDKAQRLEARDQRLEAKKEERLPQPSAARVSDDLPEAVSAWNEMAERHGLSRVAVLTEVRKRSLKQRLHECGGIEGWHHAMGLVSQSPFLLGERGEWKADFDFVLQAKSFTKLMEGSYNNQGSKQSASKLSWMFDDAENGVH